MIRRAISGVRRRLAALLDPRLAAAYERARFVELERDQMAAAHDDSVQAHRKTALELARTLRDLEMARATLRRAAHDQGDFHE